MKMPFKNQKYQRSYRYRHDNQFFQNEQIFYCSAGTYVEKTYFSRSQSKTNLILFPKNHISWKISTAIILFDCTFVIWNLSGIDPTEEFEIFFHISISNCADKKNDIDNDLTRNFFARQIQNDIIKLNVKVVLTLQNYYYLFILLFTRLHSSHKH